MLVAWEESPWCALGGIAGADGCRREVVCRWARLGSNRRSVRGWEQMFDTGGMAGGMGKGMGIPLRDRMSVVGGQAVNREPRRHCWVSGPADTPGPHPGLVISW